MHRWIATALLQHDLNLYLPFRDYTFKITPIFPRVPWITDLLQFMIQFILPNYKCTKGHEEEIPRIFKSVLAYPFMISKSSMLTVGTQHTWPHFLAALSWLREQIQVSGERDRRPDARLSQRLLFLFPFCSQYMTLNSVKDWYLGYLNFKSYSLITFCCGHIFLWYIQKWGDSVAMWATRVYNPIAQRDFSMHIRATVKFEQCLHIDGLVQERCNSSALAMELHLSCTNPWYQKYRYFLPRSPWGLWGIVVPRAGGQAAGQTSHVNTLTSTIFHGSFSILARTFITLRSRTSSIMEVLPH